MTELNDKMEQASQYLADMDYHACEVVCAEAYAMARSAKQWDWAHAILNPLQEVRRQRRMLAGDGALRVGTDGWPTEAEALQNAILAQGSAGLVVFSGEHSPELTAEMSSRMRAAGHDWIMLHGKPGHESGHWRVTRPSGHGQTIGEAAEFSLPEGVDAGLWLRDSDTAQALAHRLFEALESLGDRELAALPSLESTEPEAVVLAIESAWSRHPEHELMTQALSAALSACSRMPANPGVA